jgi:methylmalonyl-CoA mutase cobalamin-binding subunit
VAAKVPLAQSVHTRLLAAVGAAVWYLPAMQAAATAVQAVPSSAALKVVSATQSSQARSKVADGAAIAL